MHHIQAADDFPMTCYSHQIIITIKLSLIARLNKNNLAQKRVTENIESVIHEMTVSHILNSSATSSDVQRKQHRELFL